MSILIIGSDSVIGGALQKAVAAGGAPVIGTTRATLDLANPESWRLPQAKTAYICAGVTKIDACERDPEYARKVNVVGTSALAKQLSDAGTFVVFLSSNQVFDGTKPQRNPNDMPCPINEYGRQKAETEKAVIASGGAVLRLTKVIAPHDSRILEWKAKLAARETISVPDDIYLAPSTLVNVMDAAQAVGNTRSSGIFQLSGATDFSYFDMALALARQLGLPESHVVRGKAAGNIPTQFRPRYSSLTLSLPKPVTVPDMGGIIAYALAPSN